MLVDRNYVNMPDAGMNGVEQGHKLNLERVQLLRRFGGAVCSVGAESSAPWSAPCFQFSEEEIILDKTTESLNRQKRLVLIILIAAFGFRN